MPTSIALPTSHHFHPSLSPVVSLSLGILHEWMRMQMLAKPSSSSSPENWRRPPGWPRTTWMKNIHDDLSSLDLGMYMRLEIWHKIGLSGDWCHCTALQHYTFVLVHATTALVHTSTGKVAALLLRMTELRFYISPNTKQVISEMFFRDKTNKKTQLKQTCTHNKIFYNTKLTHKK